MNRLQVISAKQKRNKIVAVDDEADTAIALPKGSVRYDAF